MERINGYLDLNSISSEFTKIKNRTHAIYYFSVNNEDKFFKVCNDSEALMSILADIVAQCLDIPTVHFELATYQNQKGIVSNSYNPNKYCELSMMQILETYFQESHDNKLNDADTIDDLNNLEDIFYALQFYFKNKKNFSEVIEKIYYEIVQTFILQVVIGGSDFHCENIIILDGDLPTLAPNFDYDRTFQIKLGSQIFPYALLPSRLSKKSKNDHLLIIEQFLSMNETFYNLFFDKISLLPNSRDLVKLLENRLGFSVHPNTVSFFIKNYESYFSYLKNIMNPNLQK